MWSSWGGHGVVLGAADGFCLVCAARLRDARRAALHVAGAPHRHALSATTYFQKYKHDLIRKVNYGYFCQFCNKLLPTAAQVGLHIAETKHKENKEIQLLRRVSDGVVAFGDVLIQDDAWNGLIEDTCVLCNTDYDDKTVHQAENTHILKLIQSNVFFGDKKSIYRKIEDGSFHCLTCNDVCSTNSFAEHFDSKEHIDAHKKCEYTKEIDDTINNLEYSDRKDGEAVTAEDIEQDLKKALPKDEAKNFEENDVNKKERVGNNDEILNSVAEFQKNGLNIDFINESAKCKKCSNNVDFDYETIKKHIEDHKVTPKKEHVKVPFESGANGDNKQSLYTKPVFLGEIKETKSRSSSSSSTEEMESLIKEHGLSYKKNKLYCDDCGTRIQASIKTVKDHIFSIAHKNAKKPNPQIAKVVKKAQIRVLISKFIKDMTTVENSLTGNKEFVINEKFCINHFSLVYVGKREYSGVVGCLACNVSLPLELVGPHVSSPSHIKFMEQSLVIASLDSEFIREIKPGMFHCGFCNIVEENWDSMEDHLESSVHGNAKTAAEWHLQELLRDIRAHETRQKMEFLFLMKMMANHSPFRF